LRFTRRFYLTAIAIILTLIAGYWLSPLFFIGRMAWWLLVAVTLADLISLYSKNKIEAHRECSERFSNGDANPVRLLISSESNRPLHLEVIDEIPMQFQRRDVSFSTFIQPHGNATINYQLTPTSRGVYDFGLIRLFATTRLGLVVRRFSCGEPKSIKVYPSYLMLRQYELLAMSNHLHEMGVKRIRRIGHNTDFEQIRDYVAGDDYRTINWRATARRTMAERTAAGSQPRLMVNQYQEERSQPIFCVIDKGRMMQQAFAGLTLLDYAINASLVLGYVAMHKDDRAGLVTFSDKFDTFVAASRQPGHMRVLQEALYSEQTQFGESDFSALLAGLSHHVSRRSLMVLFTSFMGLTTMRRQLPFLRQLALRHRLLVVFFEDEELHALCHDTKPTNSTEVCYQHVIAEKFAYEQRLIVQELRQYGIQSILTPPRQLSVEVINKYLEIKTRL
jgi:uncharacterized protein (DUF58 family)